MTGIALSQWLHSVVIGLVATFLVLLLTYPLRHYPRLQTIGLSCLTVILGMTLGARQRLMPIATEETRIVRLASYWRGQLLDNYREWGISDEAYGVVAAMTLGDKSELDRDLKETYSKVGAAHILALSGLHLSIIYAIISLFIGWRRIRILSQSFIIVAIWAYALLTGMSPSVTRAALMISIYGLLSLGYRERMSVNTLAFTAIVMLLVNPMSLYNIGFQLSFMAVLAILLFNPLFNRLIPQRVLLRYRSVRLLWGMTTVSVSAQLGTAPLVAYYFGRFSTWFLLSNYLVIPLATVILYLTVFCVASFWWTALQQWVVAALSAVVAFMNHGLEALSRLPYSSIEHIRFSVLHVALIYTIIGSIYLMLSLRFPKARRIY